MLNLTQLYCILCGLLNCGRKFSKGLCSLNEPSLQELDDCTFGSWGSVSRRLSRNGDFYKPFSIFWSRLLFQAWALCCLSTPGNSLSLFSFLFFSHNTRAIILFLEIFCVFKSLWSFCQKLNSDGLHSSPCGCFEFYETLIILCARNILSLKDWPASFFRCLA